MTRGTDQVVPEALACAIAKVVRDFVHYFGTTDHPKLEEWIQKTIEEHQRG